MNGISCVHNITYKIAVTATPNGSQWAYPRIAGKDQEGQ